MLILGGLLRALLVCVAISALGAATAGAAGTRLSGQVTITGTDGRDAFEVEFNAASGPKGESFSVEPAATVTATTGTCPPDTDPLTGRPVRNDCQIVASGITLFIDLRKGDDLVEVNDDGTGLADSSRVSGGLGNDVIEVRAFGERMLQGDDGNDQLAGPGQLFSSNSPPVAYQGGTGTDTVLLDGTQAPNIGGSGSGTNGVTASLVSKTATFAGLNSQGLQTTFRTDTLDSIEALVGTDVGDVLTGGTAADTLSGGDGNDNLNGGDGADMLLGGDGLDNLIGGKAGDTVDGGLGIDTYPVDSGGDIFNTRDGFVEQVTCVKSDVIVNDLVDTVASNTAANACSVSTAAAKHLYDTKLSGKPARVADRALLTKVRCPALKPEACDGELEAVLGKRTLGRAGYDVQPGKRLAVELPIGKGNARRAEGKRILLSATEIDADGRDRFVSRPTRVAKQRR